MLSAVLFFAAFLAVNVDAIIPLPCATLESLRSRTCCPVPIPGEGPCGVGLGLGSCEPVSVPESKFNPSERDVRKNWPIQYFDKACKCDPKCGGFDCGECSYGYNDGGFCQTKTILPRVSVSSMDANDWRRYREALRSIKDSPSRYMVAKRNFTADIPELVNSLVRPTTYDLFIWLHHLMAKDNEISLNTDYFTDYAHEGTGFPTWHRLFLLWLEREIQVEINDHTFRLPYWDWSDPSQREILFREDRLGKNVEEVNTKGKTVRVVKGELFTDWNTYCWEDASGRSFPIPICDPTVPSDEKLRRCPNDTLCKMDNPNWPSWTDVEHAVCIKTYDAEPYDRYVEGDDTSFRNFMEGFIVKSNCGSDTLCTKPKQGIPGITRKLHNTVHIILGLGDITNAPEFDQQGVMSCVAASPNDPIFINHHAKIDFILEEWLEENKGSLSYPQAGNIREGHRGTDNIVPFIPLFTHEDMFKTADNFGYKYSATDDETSDQPATGSTGSTRGKSGGGTSLGVSTTLVGLTPAVTVALLMLGF